MDNDTPVCTDPEKMEKLQDLVGSLGTFFAEEQLDDFLVVVPAMDGLAHVLITVADVTMEAADANEESN